MDMFTWLESYKQKTIYIIKEEKMQHEIGSKEVNLGLYTYTYLNIPTNLTWAAADDVQTKVCSSHVLDAVFNSLCSGPTHLYADDIQTG